MNNAQKLTDISVQYISLLIYQPVLQWNGGDIMSTEAQKKASTEYNKRRDNIMVRPTKEEGAKIRVAAAAAGQSVQAYILQAITERMVRERHNKAGGSSGIFATPDKVDTV